MTKNIRFTGSISQDLGDNTYISDEAMGDLVEQLTGKNLTFEGVEVGRIDYIKNLGNRVFVEGELDAELNVGLYVKHLTTDENGVRIIDEFKLLEVSLLPRTGNDR